jgi:thioredoxin-dependent peroxiredoxin
MADITLAGNAIHTLGELPEVGSMAPSFTLTDKGLAEEKLEDFSGSKIVLNIFPSVDTAVCATSVRKFNSEASKLPDTRVLCISADLPFALARFCGAEGLEDVVVLSDFRHKSFGDDYGVRIIDGPLAGLLSRAVVVIDQEGKILHTEQVPEIGTEPDYAAALSHL